MGHIRTIFAPFLTSSGTLSIDDIAYAAALAADHKAHLDIVVGVLKPYFAFPSASRETEVVATAMGEGVRQAAQDSAEHLRTAVAARHVAVSTEVVQDDLHTLLSAMVRRARAADLVIASGTGADTPLTTSASLAEEILVASGRPIIRVGTGPASAYSLERVILAWDGGAKAARAVADAVPLLVKAGEVELVEVEEDGKSPPTQAILTNLARHDVRARLTRLDRGTRSIGDTIADHAVTTRANLIVAGGYGHSRFTEFVLGGTTARLLTEPPCPLLLSY